jgi:quinol monooxygenase YgiN
MKACVIIWQFRARKNAVSRFRKAYSREGDWARLFRHDKGFLGTELVQDLEEPRRFLTFDHWTSLSAFGRFRRKHRAEYEALDAKCEELTAYEARIGTFRLA